MRSPSSSSINLSASVILRKGISVSQPAATKLLAKLEEAGLVVREPSPTDGRASQFSLTDAGRARLAENRAIMIEQMQPYFESLSVEERQSVDRALGLVSDFLKDRHPVDGVDEQIEQIEGPDSDSDAASRRTHRSFSTTLPELISKRTHHRKGDATSR